MWSGCSGMEGAHLESCWKAEAPWPGVGLQSAMVKMEWEREEV